MRMMHIYTAEQKEVIKYLSEKYADRAISMTKEEVLGLQLFGKAPSMSSKAIERIGEVVLIARENYSFYFKYTGKEESLKSKHGSLTLQELIVPLMLFRR